MRMLPLFLVFLALPVAGCAAKAAATADDAVSGDDAAVDIAQDATVTAPPPGYTSKFRALLANKAPAELDEGERVFFEECFGADASPDLPPAAFLVQLWKGDTAKWGEQFSNYGFIVDPGDDLPIGIKRGHLDPTQAHDNCSLCHVTQLSDGRYWAGMPAHNLRWARFRLDASDAWVAAGHPALVSDAERAKILATPPGAHNTAGATDNLDVMNDFPMYADLHEMSVFNLLGSSTDLRSEVWLSVFGQLDPLPFPPAEDVAPLDAYFAWLPAPVPATPTDLAAVARGKQVFATAQCLSCHNPDDPSKNWAVDWVDGPELLPGQDKNHPHGTIATDGYFYESAVGTLDEGGGTTGGGPGPGMGALLAFIVNNGLSVQNPVGYVSSNLRAISFTDPYLHNGAVPTLTDLLKPAKDRPATFVRSGFTVDTTKASMSNAGHEFGTTLSDSDKSDLIAYLSSL